MILAIIIAVALVGLFLLGEVWPSYPAKANYLPPIYSAPPDSKGWAVLSTMPDLRVSADAPDLKSAYYAERVYLSEKESRAIYLERKRHIESMKAPYELYGERILEIKTRRWKEGNPVTKKNPIDPDEMPVHPSKYYF